MPPLKIAMIGCGGFSNRHATYLHGKPAEVELVAFVDPSRQRAADHAARFGAPGAQVFTTHQELFAAVRPDAVLITIPPFAHSDEVEMAARRGIHIFIEKPIALNPEIAWGMVDAVEKAGVVSQVGFMYRFGAVARRIKELTASGVAGEAGLMTARYFCNSLHAEWWRDRTKSGGQVFEQAVHLVDLMRYLLGEAATVYSRQTNLFHRAVPGYTVEDVSGTVFGFQSGAIGVLAATNGAIPNRWEYDFNYVARNLTIQARDADHALLTYTAEVDLRTETIASDADVYALEMDEFLNAVRTGGPTTTPMREGALTLAMAAAAMRAGESHREEPV